MVHQAALAEGRVLPLLRLAERPVGLQAQDHAVPLPREGLREEVQHQDRGCDGRLEDRLPGLAYCHVPRQHEPEERFEHETAP